MGEGEGEEQAPWGDAGGGQKESRRSHGVWPAARRGEEGCVCSRRCLDSGISCVLNKSAWHTCNGYFFPSLLGLFYVPKLYSV